MYAPVCSVQRIAELQAPGTRRREAGGGWRGGWRRLVGRLVAAGGWWVAAGGWWVAGGVCFLKS